MLRASLDLFMISLIFSALCSWYLLFLLVPKLRLNFLDHPNSRSSHIHPTPRGGGLVFVAVSAVCSATALFSGQDLSLVSLPLAATPLAVVGLFDDRHNLPSSLRFLAQLLTAFPIIVFSPLLNVYVLSLLAGNWYLSFFIFFLVIVFTAVINFINFMDGVDGLVAGCLAVAVSALAFAFDASWPLFALVGSLIGFLFWNWSPAKVFMGDVGSTFLGAVFAGLLFQFSSWSQAFGYFLVLTPLLADSCLCLIRRIFAGHRFLQPHRLHLFQRLNQAGWSHARVSCSYIGATTLLAILMFFGGWLSVLPMTFVVLLVGLWLDQRVAVPFSSVSKV